MSINLTKGERISLSTIEVSILCSIEKFSFNHIFAIPRDFN
ncbi:MAG: hypothetical protein AB4080_24640 [Trichodesmium sp.]